jgi:hypothetical protein
MSDAGTWKRDKRAGHSASASIITKGRDLHRHTPLPAVLLSNTLARLSLVSAGSGSQKTHRLVDTVSALFDKPEPNAL